MLRLRVSLVATGMPAARRRGSRAGLALALALATVLVPAVPCRAQVTWHQDHFVIGTWSDPTINQGQLAFTKRSLALARAAHFNLLTGVHHHFNSFHQTSPPAAGNLDPVAIAGLGAALTHNDFYGTASTQAADVPVFDPAYTPYVFAPLQSPPISPAANAAFSGWCLWDEPPYDSYGAPRISAFLKSWTAAMHADDAARGDGHARFAWINFFNGCGGGYTCYPGYLQSYLGDPDPRRRPDVASVTLYPFTGSTTQPLLHNYFYWMRAMRDATQGRSFWVVSLASEASAGPGFSAPDANQLRVMAFCPVAAGAKGIVWFTYQSDDGYGVPLTGHAGDPGAIVRDNLVPTCKYGMLKPINHYLESVVGPVVMKSTHLGLFHQSTQPPYGDPFGPDDFVGGTSAFVQQNCPVSSFESNGTTLDGSVFAVGVFRPSDDPSSFYLLIVNKGLVAKSTVVHLRSAYDVAQAPSVIDYVGGTNYSPLASGTSFPIRLAGGEGRMVRLSTTASPGLALTWPVGGETWPPGQTHWITWQSGGAPVDIELYADVDESGAEISGPVALTRHGHGGSSDTLTMPALLSREARIVITSRGADGIVRKATHGAALVTAPQGAPSGSSWSLGSGDCSMQAGLALDPAGVPTVVYREALGRPMFGTRAGALWPLLPVPDPLYGQYGLTATNPTIAIDRSGHPHVVFRRPYLNDLVEHGIGSDGLWHEWVVDQPHPTRDDAPVVAAPDGSLYVAYDAGASGLIVKRSTGSGWLPYRSPISGNAPHSIALAAPAAGGPWIACIEGESDDAVQSLRLFEPTPTGWTAHTLTGHFGDVALALDNSGRACVAYSIRVAPGASRVMYRTWLGSAWGSPLPVEAFSADVRGLSLAFSGGIPRIAFVSHAVAKLATLAGGTWSVETLDGTHDADAPIHLAYAPNGDRWVVFHDRSLDVLRALGPALLANEATATVDGAAPFAVLRSPNPLHAGQALLFDVRMTRPGRFEAALYDVAGRRVAALPAEPLPAGDRRVEWRLERIPAGAYFVRQSLDGRALPARRLVILR